MSSQRLTLMTFGFKYGPPNTNYYFDVSFLKNPAREEKWGLFAHPNSEMRAWVLQQPQTEALLHHILNLSQFLLTCDDDVRIGIGCSSGRHRSVIIAEALKQRLEQINVVVKLIHREENYL
jgi:UPF0042 nucleotide-binding protein